MSGFTATARTATQLTQTGAGPVGVVQLEGQLDGAAGDALQDAYRQLRPSALAAVVLDFAEVSYINSTGIALVVGLLAGARADGVEIRVCGLSEHYRHIFEITRLSDFLTFFDDEQGAIAATPTIA